MINKDTEELKRLREMDRELDEIIAEEAKTNPSLSELSKDKYDGHGNRAERRKEAKYIRKVLKGK